MVGEALGERRVATPAHARSRYDFSVRSRVKDACRVVFGFTEAPIFVIRDSLITAHFRDVNLVAKAVDGFLFLLAQGCMNSVSDHSHYLQISL